MMAWAEESFRAAAMAMAEDDWPWPCFSDQLYQLDLEYSDILGSLDTGFCHGPPPAPLSEGPLVPLSCCYEGQFSGLQQQQQIGGVPEENGQQMIMQVPEIGRQEDHAGVENGAGSVRGRRGKGKGLPAKNLMAERRRRKKLNDRLFMLRSVVPKVSKTDRASILADAIDYLKELLQSINDLSAELMAADPHLPLPGSSKSTVSALPALPCRARQDQQSQYLNSEAEPAKVEVKTKEGKKVDIHMVCSARPGLLLSTIRALDGLGLDVKEAVISCLNGFSLDISQAEQQSGEDVKAEEIKALLLHTASYQTSV